MVRFYLSGDAQRNCEPLGRFGNRAAERDESAYGNRRIEQEGEDQRGDGKVRNATYDSRAPKGRACDQHDHCQAREDGPCQAAAGFEHVAVAVEGHEARCGDGKEEEHERESVIAAQIRDEGRRHEQGRKDAAGHPDQASPLPRTFLYAPRQPLDQTKGDPCLTRR